MKMSWQYIAGFFDGEGYFGVRKYDNRKYGGQSKGLRALISANQLTKNKKVLREISKFLLRYDIQHCLYDSKYVLKSGNVSSTISMGHKTHLRKFLKKTLPFLIVKRKDAIKILTFCKGK